MADFPSSDAITKILSSVLPPKTYALFTPFLPGIFFEVSVVHANPQLAQQLILRSNEAALLGKYSALFIAVFGAFVIGHALIMWTNLVHRVLSLLYRTSRFFWRRFNDWPLAPFLSWLVTKQQQKVANATPQSWWRRPHWIVNYLKYRHRKAQDLVFGLDDTSEGARKVWALIARHMFEKRFGIDLSHVSQEELNALYAISQSAPWIALSNHLLMVATHALGWGGLAAIRFAPSLANRNYLVFSVFMIIIGVFYDWEMIRSANNSLVSALLKLRGLLRALEKGKDAGTNRKKKKQAAAEEAP
jgi:hypothetical protein